MGSRSSSRALVVVAAVALVAAGCGGASSSRQGFGAYDLLHCGSGSEGDALWSGSTLYVVAGTRVVSSRGPGVSLPNGAVPAGFRACGSPTVLYRLGDELRAQSLVSSRKSLLLGRDVTLSRDGRLVYFGGTAIRDPQARVTAPLSGLPPKWQVTSLVVAPLGTGSYLASAQSPEAGIELCGKGLGAIYRVSPAGARTLLVDNPCRDDPQPAFSPDGSRISYVDSESDALYTLRANGTDRRRVASGGKILSYLWSPDGSEIAYDTQVRGGPQVVVVDARTGARRLALPGKLEAWSADGSRLAVAIRGTVVAVGARGGHARVLLRLPARRA